MKLDVVTKDRDIQSNLSEGMDYGIDQTQMQLLYEILSQYSNPIGSIVRELTTNAFDSHLEADVDREVTVRIIESSSLTKMQNTFEVEDYGVGLSPDRVKKIYSKFLASTKRDSNKEHGAFGLGSKSPFSYTDMFTVTTVYDWIEYGYAMHKGQSTPRIDLLYKEETDAINGTKLSINIKPGDRYRFKNEIKRQLAYFENIHHVNTGVSNDYTIYEGESFLYRPDLEGESFNQIHICLGKVFYPLNLSMLDVDYMEVKTPIALKFEIGELPVVWSRENLEYTDDARELIKERLLQAVDELTEHYQKSQEDVDSIQEYYWMLRQAKDDRLEIADGVEIPHIKDLVEAKPVYPKYSKLKKLPKLKQALNSIFKVHKQVNKGIAKTKKHADMGSIMYTTYSGNNPFGFTSAYLLEGAYSTLKNKYLYEVGGYKTFYLIRKRNKSEKPSHAAMFAMFGYDVRDASELDKHTVSLVRSFLIEVKEYLERQVKHYDEDVEVSQKFKDARKGSTKADMFDPSSDEYDPTLKIHLKEAKVAQPNKTYVENNYSVWEPAIGNLAAYSNSLTIYGFSKDSDVIDATAIFLARFYNHRWHWETPKHRMLNILKIAKNKEDAILTLMDNAIHVNEFYSRKHSMLINTLTRFYIMTVLEDTSTFPLRAVTKDLALPILKGVGLDTMVEDYAKAYQNVRFIESASVPTSYGKDAYKRSLPKPFHPLFNNPAYINQSLIDEYHKVQLYFKKYPLLYFLLTKKSISGDEQDVIIEEMKYYVKGKSPINPLLEERLQEYKNQTTNQQQP